MNGNKRFLLDTNAIISLLGGNTKLNKLVSNADWLGISIVSQLEFLSYPRLDNNDELLFNRFKERISVVDLSVANIRVIETIIQIRKKKRAKLPDAIIAGTAIALDAVLLTADEKILKTFPHNTQTF